MPAAFEFGREPLPHHGNGHPVADKTCRHHQHVGKVVGFDQMGHGCVPGQSGPYALMLVEGNGHAVAGTADGDALVHLTLLHGKRQGMGKVGIIAGISGVGAEIHHLVAFSFQILDELEFVFHARMVVADAYCHISSSIL